MLRPLIVKLASSVPPGARQWLYRHPRLLGPAARMLKRMVPADGQVIVTISAGPNQGMKFVTDRQTPNYYWLNDQYERDVVAALRQNVREGMVVADIGAHLGFDTLMLSQWVGARGKVLAFEPDPHSFGRLIQNIEINALGNVLPFEAAVSDKAGRLRFAAGGEATSHLANAEETGVEVDVVCLDEVIFKSEPPRLDLVKVDVEDNEVAVLRGARRVLRELRPILLIEVHSFRSLAGCVAELRAAGYHMQPIPPRDCFERAIAAPDAAASGAADFQLGHLLCLPAA